MELLSDQGEASGMTDTTHTRTLVIVLTDEEYNRLKTWEPCTRIRLVPVDDETARLEIDARAICLACHGTGRFSPGPDVDMRCRYCRGTGLR
jgi:hypothetical protein